MFTVDRQRGVTKHYANIFNGFVRRDNPDGHGSL